jgi:phosphoribosylformimino-5-aminoimidazole carboxamide ribotide isomerase
MYIIPAIDLIDGKCVRLIQGKYDRQITYNNNPVEQALQFAAQGAQWLHIVDLDGARLGRPVNTETIEKIAKTGKLKIEVGGGIRDEQSIKKLLDIGIERVIIGTRAAADFEWFDKMTSIFPSKIALGLDAKGTKVSTEGWTKELQQTILEFAIKASQLAIAAIIYTDISKDGMMKGPNLQRTKEIADVVNKPVIASGGINTVEDIQNLIELRNIEGAIIGRALYEGTLKLADTIKTASQQVN